LIGLLAQILGYAAQHGYCDTLQSPCRNIYQNVSYWLRTDVRQLNARSAYLPAFQTAPDTPHADSPLPLRIRPDRYGWNGEFQANAAV